MHRCMCIQPRAVSEMITTDVHTEPYISSIPVSCLQSVIITFWDCVSTLNSMFSRVVGRCRLGKLNVCLIMKQSKTGRVLSIFVLVISPFYFPSSGCGDVCGTVSPIPGSFLWQGSVGGHGGELQPPHRAVLQFRGTLCLQGWVGMKIKWQNSLVYKKAFRMMCVVLKVMLSGKKHSLAFRSVYQQLIQACSLTLPQIWMYWHWIRHYA